MKGYFFVGLILSMSIYTGSIPAGAQSKGFKVDTNYLPKADKIYPAPWKINIVNTSPQVTGPMPEENSPVYVIPINPTTKSYSTTTIVLPGNATGQAVTPVGSTGGSYADQPGHPAGPAAIIANPNKLPAAGFSSYIPARIGPTASLPQGTTTQGLRGRLITPQSRAQQRSNNKKSGPDYGMENSPAATSIGPGVAEYAPISSASVSGEGQVRATVSGKIQRRSLLNSK